MNEHPRRRSGFALALAIAALCVIGTLIAGVFFASTQEYRLGRNALLQARALTAAELGLHAVTTPSPVGVWTPSLFAALAIGETTSPVELLPGDGAVDSVRITRLNELDFLVVSEGRAGTAQGARARRRLSALVTLRVPRPSTLAALTIRGSLTVADSASINGGDTTLTGWSCLTGATPLPGVVTEDTSQVSRAACAGSNCLLGTPPLAANLLAADTNTYFNYGDSDWRELTGKADKIVGGTIGGMTPTFDAAGKCNTSDPANWGDASRTAANASCQLYYPIIYAPGDLSITGGAGQGILLVDGDLQLSGGAEFVGVVVVRGRLTSGGTGGRLTGSVMVANARGGQSTIGGHTNIRHSSCAAAAALLGSARPATGDWRLWNELF